MHYKEVFAILAVMIAIMSYVPYFRDMFAGRTKPHAFSWLVWGILNGIAFVGQLHDKGGASAWAVGFTALALCSIFVYALVKGEKAVKPFDWICLGGALLALVPWFLTDDPLTSIILITVIDALGFLPTIRKSFTNPRQETLSTYVLSVIKYLLVVFALAKYTPVTVLFPLALVNMNGLFVLMLLVRRRQVAD